MSFLGSWGVKIPRDISIISGDSEPFLDCMVPLPARYVVAPQPLPANSPISCAKWRVASPWLHAASS
ncbi:MAG: hypothetical protein JWO89_2908 [Verrucomicrobiaceae bacterium]|nr:hypothetical protein [Verrucomicrobiaceae bacterium]